MQHRCLRVCQYSYGSTIRSCIRRGLLVVSFTLLGMRRPQEAEQQQCSPAFFMSIFERWWCGNLGFSAEPCPCWVLAGNPSKRQTCCGAPQTRTACSNNATLLQVEAFCAGLAMQVARLSTKTSQLVITSILSSFDYVQLTQSNECEESLETKGKYL